MCILQMGHTVRVIICSMGKGDKPLCLFCLEIEGGFYEMYSNI